MSIVSDLQHELDVTNGRIEMLTATIQRICVAGGMIKDMPITGAQALQFGNEFAECLYRDKERQSV